MNAPPKEEKKKRRFEGQSSIVAHKREKERARFMPVVTEPRNVERFEWTHLVSMWGGENNRRDGSGGCTEIKFHTHTKKNPFQIQISHAWREIANRVRKCTSSFQKGGKLKTREKKNLIRHRVNYRAQTCETRVTGWIWNPDPALFARFYISTRVRRVGSTCPVTKIARVDGGEDKIALKYFCTHSLEWWWII